MKSLIISYGIMMLLRTGISINRITGHITSEELSRFGRRPNIWIYMCGERLISFMIVYFAFYWPDDTVQQVVMLVIVFKLLLPIITFILVICLSVICAIVRYIFCPIFTNEIEGYLSANFAQEQYEQIPSDTEDIGDSVIVYWTNDITALMERLDINPNIESAAQLYEEKEEEIDEGKGEFVIDMQECGICLSAYIDEDKLLLLPCKHYFHYDCCMSWYRSNDNVNTCPLCRSNIYNIV